ncbi:metallophosphoesterase family protein [Dactylosporangium matsuzakiense]|uniref:Phosphoesterase n=1 Tax=Dactylosporangium matsuzakiense TaxID=53360 RepID=A0A9W6NQ27_9ACTN|nr:metallophosphoesterase family protein [Dactylosporangium matsuzakiense]UWZ42001.1 metallophosphoesterase family protein [Dactylosporangium matsuzakiense]GLL04918.1 phosphoesterase [Dactylosporangium matsuzakiense]
MRVAVLADVHANLPALEAVLDDVDTCGADRIVLLGDIAGGPLPAETLDRLAALGDRAVWVHGNGEREIVDAFDGRPGDGRTGADAADCAALIEQRHRDLLHGLPLTVTLDVDGLGPVLFCHATPRRDDEFVLVDSPVARWNAVLGGVSAPLVVCGHTHMPFDRLADRRRVVNPGSVGMNYGPPGAYWALLGDGVVQLRRTPYDARRAAARIVAGRHPQAAWWAEQYVTAPYSDADALAAFTGLTRD